MKVILLEDIPGLSKVIHSSLDRSSLSYMVVNNVSELSQLKRDQELWVIHFAFKKTIYWQLSEEFVEIYPQARRTRILCSEQARVDLQNYGEGGWDFFNYLEDFQGLLSKMSAFQNSVDTRRKGESKGQIYDNCHKFENHFSETSSELFGHRICNYIFNEGIAKEVFFVDYDLWQNYVLDDSVSVINSRKNIRKQKDIHYCNMGVQVDPKFNTLLLKLDEAKDYQNIRNYHIYLIRSQGGSPLAFLMLKNTDESKMETSFVKEYLFPRLGCLYSDKKIQNDILEQSYRDDVTQLYNQRYLPIALDECIKSFHDQGEAFSVLFIDVDFFKKVNDTQGHLMGSSILANLGDIIVKNTREQDFAFRYGGDEFLIILRNTKSDVASHIAERIRKEVENHEFRFGEHRRKITISIGIAACPEHAATKEDVIELADQAMYYGKNKSRNIVYVAS